MLVIPFTRGFNSDRYHLPALELAYGDRLSTRVETRGDRSRMAYVSARMGKVMGACMRELHGQYCVVGLWGTQVWALGVS